LSFADKIIASGLTMTEHPLTLLDMIFSSGFRKASTSCDVRWKPLGNLLNLKNSFPYWNPKYYERWSWI